MLPLSEAVKKLERLKELVDEYNPIKYESTERTRALGVEIPQLYGEVEDVYRKYGGAQRVELVEGKNKKTFPSYFEAGYLSGRTIHASEGYRELLKVLGRVRQEATNEGTSGQPTTSTKKGNDVFIVHGHDEPNLFRLRDLIEKRFKLHPVILKWQAGIGRAMIEKFEQEAERCGYAFVLLTPDDQIEAPDGQYTQARPNVVFELGWFYGRLSRSRVAILLRKGTKLHSDLEGISRIEFVDSVEEKVMEIERELHAVGLIPRPES